MINTANSQSYINIPRGDSVISLLNSFLDLNFDVFHAADPDNRYAGGDDIRLVNLGPIVLFSNFKLTSSNGHEPIEEGAMDINPLKIRKTGNFKLGLKKV